MNSKFKRLKSKAMFTIVGGVIVINPAFAQDAAQQQPAAQQESATTLDTVTVTGMRSSLDQAMNIRRDSAGVVDAISAEDIGKFPDTNLAESLQRITGISIERRDGEGAQITARGFGPEFNLVTLNGRQIPGADAFGSAGQVAVGGVNGGTRAFNFAQLTSDAISGIEVYKTSQASVPSGGIGATLNILTDRPFNHAGGEIVATAGVKAVSDQSQVFGNNVTPEVTGIFSYASPDKRWGIGASASYQKRHGGSVQSTVNNWNVQRWVDGAGAGLRADGTLTNAPDVGQLYALPNDIRYAFSDFERERVNGQVVLQFAPTDAVTLTLDYTYASNEIDENRGEQTQWLQQGQYTHLSFDDGAVATPTYLREWVETKDFGYEQQRNMQRYRLDSLGLNADWQVTDSFNLKFDAHNTKSRSNPNDPVTGGGATYASIAGTNNCTSGPYCGGAWSQEMWFNNSLPIAARNWYASIADSIAGANGVVNPAFPVEQIGSQVVRVNAQTQETEIKQGRIDGALDFDNGRFQFGVDSSKTNLRRLQATENYSTLGDWGATNTGDEPGLADLLTPTSILALFNDFNTGGAPASAWRGNATDIGLWAVDAYGANMSVNPILAANNSIEEKTNAAYMQVELDGQLGSLTTHTRAGIRYEKTDVVSTSVITPASAIEWQANNDFRIVPGSASDAVTVSGKHSYSYILPNLDFSVDLTADLKARVSFGQSIARSPWSNLYAGATPTQPNGSTLISSATRGGGNATNPALDPIESDNLDLALEWYFADSSFVQVTYWNKRVDNFIGNSVVEQNLFGLTDPTAGPDAQAAAAFLASGACESQVTAAGGDPSTSCALTDTTLFVATAMLRNAATSGGLDAYDGSGAQVQAIEAAYQLYGEADDPLYMFNVNTPINQNAAKLHGWELGGQYFFGDTGFGILANYTIVDGDVNFNNAGDPGVDQFALLGLSDTANAVLMYEKYGWSARLAWNWRDEYLILANQGGSRNPFYVEAYDQFDLAVNYAFNDHLSVGVEAINITGEDVRWHARSEAQLVRLVDQSPRYAVGVRYKF